MTSFSIASSALSNSASPCDFHGSTARILPSINAKKSRISLICSLTVNGFLAKLVRKLV